MAGIGGAEIGNFAFDPSVRIFALDMGADGGDQVAHFPDAALGWAETEAHLIGEGALWAVYRRGRRRLSIGG